MQNILHHIFLLHLYMLVETIHLLFLLLIDIGHLLLLYSIIYFLVLNTIQNIALVFYFLSFVFSFFIFFYTINI